VSTVNERFGIEVSLVEPTTGSLSSQEVNRREIDAKTINAAVFILSPLLIVNIKQIRSLDTSKIYLNAMQS
jgi:hypothetical protein